MKLPILALTTMSAYGQWVDAQFAYKPKDQTQTTRIEAGFTRGKLTSYGFVDVERNPTSAYGEARAAYLLSKIGIGPAAEVNAGTRYADTVRLGVNYARTFSEGSSITAKYYPWEATGKKGAQASIYAAQKFNKIVPSILIDYNIKPKATYMELELEYNVGKHLALYGQMRGAGSFASPKLQPLVGLRFKR